MKNIKKILLQVPILLVLFSCNNIDIKKSNNVYVQIDDLLNKKSNIVTFNINNIRNIPSVYYFNKTDSCLNIKSIIDSNDYSIYKLNKVLKKEILETFSIWLIVNEDSIFAISQANNKVYLFNTNDVIIDSFPLYSNYNKDDYVCFSTKISPMKLTNNKLIIPTNSPITYNESKKEYFDLIGIIIDLKNKKIQKFGRHSSKKINNSISYTRPYNKFNVYKNKIVFSSEEDANIYEYNFDINEYKSYYAKSKYIDYIPVIPDSLRKNRIFVKNYTIEEARYSNLTYYMNNNYILRLVKHKTTIQKSDGIYKNKLPNSIYSIIIIDTNKNTIINEIMLDTSNSMDFILCLNDYFLLINKESLPLIKTGKLCLDIYGIK